MVAYILQSAGNDATTYSSILMYYTKSQPIKTKTQNEEEAAR